MSNSDPPKIEFPPVSAENLIRLGKDLLYAESILRLDRWVLCAETHVYASSVSDLVSRGETPTGFSSAEAASLAKTFYKAVLELSSPVQPYTSWTLWFRLYTHALLLESRIFLNVELHDKSPDYTPYGFTDTWKGSYRGKLVCIKAIRPCLREVDSGTLRRKIIRSKYVSHPNVLPVIEASETLFPFCIMSPWMPNGNIAQYTQLNPGANRLVLLSQACRGLMYLHGLSILHGCITPGNILITADGQACLGDYGTTGAFAGFTSRSWHRPETLRYTAPESFDEVYWLPSVTGLSKAGDVYSFAMVSFGVLTGILPYDDSHHDTIAKRIRSGVRPPRPADPSQNQRLQDPVWDVITSGWNDEPEQRCGLSVMRHVFLTSSRQEVRSAKLGDLGLQQLGKILPRITFLLQFLRDPEPEIEKRVDEMDKRLEDHTISDRERLKLFNKLCKTCSRHRVIPKSMHIPDCSKDSVEVECGGYANVSRSTYEGRRVAIKVVRVYITSDLDIILSRFCREGVAWKHLRHPNILPLLGVTVSERRFAMVSEWMEHGNINEFVERDRHVNRTELLAGVADGLKYMHDLRIVHGDLKGANILINEDRRACIADFGLTTITGVVNHATAGVSKVSLISNDTLMSFTAGGTYRWMSPELLDPERFGIPESEGNRPTKQSDSFALGMVIYEVLCGHHPYLEIPSDILVMNAITEGVRPEKPEEAKRLGFSNELWVTVERCWLEDRNARPSIDVILSCLSGAAAFWYMREF